MPSVSRSFLERTKWALYIAIPVWFGYGLARNEEWLEIVKEKFPTKAADARGDHGRTLPTLEEEYKRVRLERLIDEELDRLATERGASNKSGKK